MFYAIINYQFTTSELKNVEKLAKQTVQAFRWLDTVFQGQYVPSLSINHKQSFGKITTTVVSDKDENLL